MSETQRTTIDTARDNAHTQGRILVSYATEFNAAGASRPITTDRSKSPRTDTRDQGHLGPSNPLV